MNLSPQTKPYPRYLYHRDFNEPKIVNSKVEEVELGTKGWVTSYIHKDYPKWVGDKIVRSKEEEERLLASQTDPIDVSVDIGFPTVEITSPPDELFVGEDPAVTKETRINGVDPTVVEKPKEGNGRRKKKK